MDVFRMARTGRCASALMVAAVWGMAWAALPARAEICQIPQSEPKKGGEPKKGEVSPQHICPGDPEPPPPSVARGARFMGQSVPTTMVVWQPYSVSVSMRNAGTETWTDATGYRLGSQNPGDNFTWGMHRVAVPGAVAQDYIATFNFTARAPLSAGSYNFQWRMVQDGVTWFGETTPNVAVTVLASTITGHIDGIQNGRIVGWACSTRINDPIDVHVYLGGQAGTGTMVGGYRADQPSESGVAASCQASGSAYRFSIPISNEMVTQHGGKTIYIHGISPVGAPNLTIGS